jgi:phosphatidate cytidylyltransferase
VLPARLATAAVALPTLIWLIFFGPAWAFAGFVVAVTAVGLGEFSAMAFPGYLRAQLYAIGLGLGLAAVVVLHRPDVLGFVLALAVSGGLLLALTDRDMPGAVSRLAHGLLAALYVGYLLPHVVTLQLLPGGGPRWVFLAIACSMGSDSAAYFAGRLFGRTKLFPRVSPSKTVEGAMGAILGSLIVAWGTLAFLPPPGLNSVNAVWVALAIGLLSQAGDLGESMLKRAFGAKDSGWIFPGHGGVLDRIDSLVLPIVFTYYWNAGMGF